MADNDNNAGQFMATPVTGALSPRPVAVTLSVRAHVNGPDPSTQPSDAPRSGPLVDRYGRVHDDLRVSVTDRCNLRCVYCMPLTGMQFLARDELLTFDEIVEVASVAFELGIKSIRLTGGEPLVRHGLVDLVARLSALGFQDLAMTTNAMRLAPVARALYDAGLTRVNVSCDSLRDDRFASIRRRGDLRTVLDAMDVAESVGLAPLKVNVVLVRGVNDDEVEDFADFARQTGRVVRFIEVMPLDAQGAWDREQLVSGQEIYERVSARWPLVALAREGDAAPAERFRFADGRGEIGMISSVTQPFCGTCNRLRLTADGDIRNCLFSDDELTVRDAVRAGDRSAIAQLFRDAVWAKYPGHAINDPSFLRPLRSMSMIGG